MKKLHALVFVSTLAAGGTAFAHAPHGRKLERFDQNGDGKVTLQEMKSAAAQRFAEIDGNKDGRISQDEFAAHGEKMRVEFEKRRAERADTGDVKRHRGHGKHHGKDLKGKMFERMDTNADGHIDRKEYDAAIERRFARMDKNGDGVIEAGELRYGRGKHGKGGKHGKHGDAPQQGAAGKGGR
jgi:Ca2+-binding EF-hand superfamily protein